MVFLQVGQYKTMQRKETNILLSGRPGLTARLLTIALPKMEVQSVP